MGDANGYAGILRKFHHIPKLIEAVVAWLDHDRLTNIWHNETGGVYAPLSVSILETWQQWRKWGTLPAAGGWLDQPLGMLAQMSALNLVFETWQFYRSSECDFAKMSPTQRWIVAEFDK